MKSFWLFMIWATLFLYVIHSLEEFDQTKIVCLEISKTFYTTDGAPVLGQDGKPVPCVPLLAEKK